VSDDRPGSDPSADDGEDRGSDETGDPAGELTHVEDGDAGMVDVGDKPDSRRRAVATGTIHLRPSTVAAVEADGVEKGDVLTTARIGAIDAVKHTWEAIPLCHGIPITAVDVEFSVGDDRIGIEVAVETTGKTGCEMEALQGVTTGLNVVWDMVKAAEKDDDGGYPETRIDGVRVVEKTKRPP
jgi:cyclic pyranopterin phosphate synthase